MQEPQAPAPLPEQGPVTLTPGAAVTLEIQSVVIGQQFVQEDGEHGQA